MPKLLLPLVSVGNVPQLCCDLLLHSLPTEFKFIKHLDSIWLHSFLGPVDYVVGRTSQIYDECQEDIYTTPLELFYSEVRDLYVIQQRSPIVKGYENEFCKKVIQPLIAQLEISHIIVLDTIDVFDSMIPIPNLSKSSKFSVGKCDIHSIENISSELELKLRLNHEDPVKTNNTLFKFSSTSFQDSISTEQFIYKLTYHLSHGLSHHPKLSEIIYFNVFIYECDNSRDALLMCEMLSDVIPDFDKIKNYAAPISWKGVYGTRPMPRDDHQYLYT